MKSLTIKILAAVSAFCLLFSSCSQCSLSNFVGCGSYYQFAFKENGCVYAACDAASKIGSECSLVTHIKEISDSGEEKLLAEIPTTSICCGEGRLWYSLCGTLFSCTLGGDDLRIELQSEKVRRITPVSIKKGRLLLYSFYPPAGDGDPYAAVYSAFDPETGEETLLCEPSTQVRYLDVQADSLWNGEEVFCSYGRGEDELPHRIGPEGCTLVSEEGSAIGLSEDGTAYWAISDMAVTGETQLEIFWQKKGGTAESVEFTLPQYQHIQRFYLTEDERVMITALYQGLWSLYCFTPETGELAAIFANRYQGYEYLFFDEENYYCLSPSVSGFEQGPLIPLYDLQ